MLTTGEAAQLLGVTSQTVINWIASGKLSAVRVGRGRRRVSEASLRLLIEQNGIPAETNSPELWTKVRGMDDLDPAMPACFASDASSRIILWSPAVERLLGWSAHERIGTHLSEIPTRVPGLPVDLAELAREPGEETRLSLLLEFVRRDDTKISMETTLSWFQNVKGRTVGTVFVLEPAEQVSPRVVPSRKKR